MTYMSKLRELVSNISLHEDGKSDYDNVYAALLIPAEDYPEIQKETALVLRDYEDGLITKQEALNKAALLNAKVAAMDAAKAKDNPPSEEKPAETPATLVTPPDNKQWQAISTKTDFEGNPIPQKFLPVYIINYGGSEPALRDLDFTKRALRGLSAWSEPNQIAELKTTLQTMFPDMQFEEIDVTDALNDPPAKPKQEPVKHNKEDLAVDKVNKSDIVVPDSKIVHKNAVVDIEEMLKLAQAGIYPEFVYQHPKLHFRWINNDGEKKIIALYGISKIEKDGEPDILVRDVLPPIRGADSPYWKKQEGPTYMLPASTVLSIIHSPLNADIVDGVLAQDDEVDDPQVWVDKILQAKEVMDNKFKEWKDKNWREYDLDQYTDESLIDVYLANVMHSHGLPMKFALKKYGKLRNEEAEKKLKTDMDMWYNAYKKKYSLDRFDSDTIFDIYTAVKSNKMNIEDAIEKYGLADKDEPDPEEVEDDSVEESVLTERRPAGELDDKSKENLVRDPNVLRDILDKIGIDPTYVSNPIVVNYPEVRTQDRVTDDSEKDKRYIIVGIKKPNLFTPINDSNIHDIDTFYLKDINEYRARPFPVSFSALRRMLSAAENDDVTPDMWEKAATLKSQRRSLNRGTGYKHFDIPDAVVINALKTIQANEPDYEDYDLVKLYLDSKGREASSIVTTALRHYYPDSTVLVHPNYNKFKNYRYMRELTTGNALKLNTKGSQGPYKHLLWSFSK